MNPYAASSIASPRSAAGVEQREETPRTYRLKMEWADRRRFLRAVLPLRLYGIIGLFLAGVGFLGMIGLAIEWREYVGFQNRADVLQASRTFLFVVRTAMIIATCWFNWKLADALATTAGGASGSMSDWSRYQLRLAQLLVATVALNVVIEAWDWFVRSMLANLAKG